MNQLTISVFGDELIVTQIDNKITLAMKTQEMKDKISIEITPSKAKDLIKVLTEYVTYLENQNEKH
jgi:hypothetical protein